VLDNVARTSLAVRLVGKVGTEADAYAAAGVAGSQAEYLLGNGDFVAIVHDSAVRFQAAYIGDYDFHLSLERLHRGRPPALLAQPASKRPTHRIPGEEGVKERDFVLGLDGRPAVLGEAETEDLLDYLDYDD
jgi:hypothetical protein